MILTVLLSIAIGINATIAYEGYITTPSVESVAEVNYEVVTARVTGYAPFDSKGICNNGDPSNTATMTLPSRGTLAVDPRKIPYGTKLYIEGYGEGTALDTGGALRRYEGIAIDLYFETHKEAMAWGVRYIDVKVYKDGE